MSMKPLISMHPGDKVCLCRECKLSSPRLKNLDPESGSIGLSDGSVYTGLDLTGTHVAFKDRPGGIESMVYISTCWDGLLEFFIQFASWDFREMYNSDARWNRTMSNINRYLFPHFLRLYRTYIEGGNKKEFYAGGRSGLPGATSPGKADDSPDDGENS